MTDFRHCSRDAHGGYHQIIPRSILAWLLFSEPSTGKVRVAAIQPNIQISERESKEGIARSFHRLEQLTRTADVSKADLIAWPESAVAGNLQNDRATVAALQSLTQATGVPIVGMPLR